jgi:hypothetical protein
MSVREAGRGFRGPVNVGRGDVFLVHSPRQCDAAGELAVADFWSVAGLGLMFCFFVAARQDVEGVVGDGDGDVHVIVGVYAGEIGSDDERGAVLVLLNPQPGISFAVQEAADVLRDFEATPPENVVHDMTSLKGLSQPVDGNAG